MRIVTIAILSLILFVSARAETVDHSFTPGLPKVELVQELAVSGMRKLLGWSGGNAYFAKKDGSVSVVSKDGKELFALQAKDNKDAAILKQPEGVVVSDGVIYVVDSETDRVAMFNLQGKYQGSFGPKSGGFFSGKGNALSSPHGIAVHEGIIYVTDTDNGRIQMFGSNGVFLATLEIDSPQKTLPSRRNCPTSCMSPQTLRLMLRDKSMCWIPMMP